jgi:hypothetical protein
MAWERHGIFELALRVCNQIPICEVSRQSNGTESAETVYPVTRYYV